MSRAEAMLARKEAARKRAERAREEAIASRAASENAISNAIYDNLVPFVSPQTASSLTTAADWVVPGVGAAITAEDSLDILREADSIGDYALGIGMGGLALAETVPLVGKAIGKPGRAALKGGMKGAGDDLLAFAGDEFGGVGKKATDLPQLRGMNVDEATAIARKNPHLIPSSKAGEGAYVGGPRNIKNRRQLTAQRKKMDAQVERGAAGGDWYDRYRAGVDEVTGGDPVDADWMTAQHGQFSAGVSPEGELAFTTRDLNSGLATGLPVKAARPAQQKGTMAALESRDPMGFMLGKKTGEYARRVNPRAGLERTATGVNDFRHARTLGYTEASGAPQTGSIGEAGHRFADFETANMVDRANKRGLAGRSDWTGEQIQAAPWVAQKADDFYARHRSGYLKKAKEALRKDNVLNPTQDQLEEMGQQIAFDEANRTITDFFPKHTAYGSYEAQPYVGSGQLPLLADATPAEKLEFATDPRSSWMDEAGRDAIYAGYREPDTGYAMRVRPTAEATGTYTPPGGATETNPAFMARPLVSFETTKAGHRMPVEDRALMDAAEATRAYVDVQGAGAWHKPQFGGVKVADRDMARLSFGDNRPRTLEELETLRGIGEKYGLGDVVDTGGDATMANFMGFEGDLGAKQVRGLMADLEDAGFGGDLQPGRLDSGYLGYEGKWEEGGGAATRQLMETLDNVPASTRQKLDNNPAIPKAAVDRMERDAEYAARYGITREDIANARSIIGEGPGWIGRLKEALAAGAVLPAVGMLMMGQEPEMSLEGA